MDTLVSPAPLPALPGFLARKVIAAGATGRRALIETMRAELAWAEARWHRDNPNADADRAQGTAPRMPHEQAAAEVLNCWGHLQPVEASIIKCWTRMHAQRRAGWTASETARDLRWYLTERRKLAKRFDELAEVYHKERAKVMA